MKPIVLLKRIIFAAALIPAAALVLDAFQGDLTANPIEYITHTTGDWAIRFLVITLAVTPIRRITGWNPVIQLRRMLGLFSFFYATLHFLTWFVSTGSSTSARWRRTSSCVHSSRWAWPPT